MNSGWEGFVCTAEAARPYKSYILKAQVCVSELFLILFFFFFLGGGCCHA